MTKQFWIIVIVILGVFIGIVTFGNKTSNKDAKPTNHVEGQGSVSLVEYGDYQCPYCGQYASTVTEVAKKYSTQITFQFRNFPLTSIHQNSFAAARAAEAAGLMGKFWEMNDILYQQNVIYYSSNQSTPTWIGAKNPESVFVSYAKSLGLDTNKFQELYASDQVNNLINADENAGNNLKVDSTPTFFLNGKKIQVNNTLQDFSKLIDAALANTKSTTGGAITQTKK